MAYLERLTHYCFDLALTLDCTVPPSHLTIFAVIGVYLKFIKHRILFSLCSSRSSTL